MSNLLSSALALHDRGLAVVPLHGKQPTLKGWQTRRLSPEELATALRSNGATGIGVVAGQLSGGLAVLDFDGEGWPAAYDAFLQAWPEAERAPRVRTGSGKMHVWLQCPDMPADFTNKSFDRPDLRASVEIRGNRSNCVAPPSIHPDTQKPYAWDTAAADMVQVPFAELRAWWEKWAGVAEETPAAGAQMASIPVMITAKMRRDLLALGLCDADINSMTPAEAWQRLGGAPATVKPAPPADDDTQPAALAQTKPDRRQLAYVRAALEGETRAVRSAPEGRRNGRLNQAAFALGRYVGGVHLDRAEVEAHLLAAATMAGLSVAEAEATIKSGLDAGVQEPKHPPIEDRPRERARPEPPEPPKDAASLADLAPWVRDVLAIGGKREVKLSIAEELAGWLLAHDALVVDDCQDTAAGGRPYIAEDGALWPIEADAAPVRLLLHRAGLNGSEVAFSFVLEHLRMTALDRGRHTRLLRWQEARDGSLYVTCGARHLVRAADGRLERVVNGSGGVWAAGDAVYPEWTPAPEVHPLDLAAFRPPLETPPEVPAYTPQAQGVLLSAWIAALLSGMRPLPILLCLGQRGGGKSTLARAIVKMLMGPTADLTGLGADQRDFEALLSCGVAGLDNLDAANSKDSKSRIFAPWLPDALSIATTGGVIRRRRLYSDGAEVSRPISAALVLTTRSADFVRADVSERVLPILTGELSDDGRLADADLMGEVVAQRDGLLSWATAAGAVLLASRPHAPRGLPLRFQDFAAAVWAFDHDGAAGILSALRAAQALAVQESDPLAEALIAHADALIGWHTPADLIKQLDAAGAELPFMGGGKAISRRLRELRATLRLAGLGLYERQMGHGVEWSVQKG